MFVTHFTLSARQLNAAEKNQCNIYFVIYCIVCHDFRSVKTSILVKVFIFTMLNAPRQYFFAPQ